MDKLVVTTLLLLLCCWGSLSLIQTCSGPLCHVMLDHPDHFAVNHNLIVVGLRNEIVQLTLDFKQVQSAQSFSNRLRLHCLRRRKNGNLCNNYYRSIIFPTGHQTISGFIGRGYTRRVTVDKTFIACSTNYFAPSCEYRMISDLSVVRKNFGIGFCPERSDIPLAFAESDTTLWVGTTIKSLRNSVLVKSRQPFDGPASLATVYRKDYWLNASSFVDMYEREDYVYAFFREITVEFETDPMHNAVRSRVARICKWDRGTILRYQGLPTFQTFIKANIRCAVQTAGSTDERFNLPFYYDHLYDTTLIQRGSYNQSSTVRPTQLYGVFQSSGNGPMGSAVCVYTLDHMSNDVTTVYGGNFWKIDANTGESQTVFSSKNLTCDTGGGAQNPEIIIMHNDVEQANPASYPLYFKNGQKFHKIAVGQVRGLDDVMYEVMFIAAENEEGNYFITKVSYVVGRGEQRSVEHDVMMLDQSDRRINHMYYHERGNGKDMLYISTSRRLYRMNPFYCVAHLTCTACVASMDPYCVYDTIQRACVGINSANRNAALQNVTGGVASCPKSDIVPSNSTATLPTPSNLVGGACEDNDFEEAWKWAGIGTLIGMGMGFITGVSFVYTWQRLLRLCHESRGTKINRKKTKPVKGAQGSGNGRETASHRPASKYANFHNEIPNREYLNSTAVNESFDIEALRRTDHESFHSLSCLVNRDDQ